MELLTGIVVPATVAFGLTFLVGHRYRVNLLCAARGHEVGAYIDLAERSRDGRKVRFARGVRCERCQVVIENVASREQWIANSQSALADERRRVERGARA